MNLIALLHCMYSFSLLDRTANPLRGPHADLGAHHAKVVGGSAGGGRLREPHYRGETHF